MILGSTTLECSFTMGCPEDRRYLESHEWHKAEGDLVVIGISQFAADELTDITYLEVRVRDGDIKAGEPFGEIESVKTTTELYCGIDAEVVAVNQEAVDQPEIINADPFGRGWIIKVRPADGSQLDSLLTAQEYDQKTH